MSFDGPLAVWLREQPGLLSLQQIVYVVRRTADALQQLHNQQIIYQDINLYSLLIHTDGKNPERIDLRLADLSAPTHAPTRFGLMYMAPEQWVGHIVPATDQYALAVIAYELLTGLPPFQGPPAKLMDLHINVQPSAPSTLNPRVSPAIDSVILSALAKRPEDRFPSVFAFARALEQAVLYPDSLLVNVPRTTTDGNLRATLPISRAEALTGTLRTITLPQGRRVTVPVPERAYDGQIIRLDGFGDPYPTGGSAGPVLLSIAIMPTDTSISTTTETSIFPTSPTQQKETKVLPRPAALALSSSRDMATRVYTTVANLPRGRRATLLASLVLILVLGATGLFLLLQPGASVPIPYAPNSGSLALNDPLHDNTKGYNWPNGISSGGGTCQFTQGVYQVIMTQAKSFHYCIAESTRFSNFAYQVNMTILKGDGGGIIFCADGANGKFYYFHIGRDGSYDLYLYNGGNGTGAQALAHGVAAAIHTGVNVPNLLAVVVHNGTIDLYVNKQQIPTSVNNSTYTTGQIGVAATYDTDPTEVVFSDATVWMVS